LPRFNNNGRHAAQPQSTGVNRRIVIKAGMVGAAVSALGAVPAFGQTGQLANRPPLFAVNDGVGWTQPGCWHAIYNASRRRGIPFGYRAYAGVIQGAPVAWDQRIAPPSGTTARPDWHLTSWTPGDLHGLIAGKYDNQLISWAKSCQRYGGKGGTHPGGLIVTVYHEADAHISPAEINAMHKAIYPLFRRYAPDILYCQVLTGYKAGLTTSVFSAAANGGVNLPCYALDGYTDVSNRTGSSAGYRTPLEVFRPGFDHARRLVPGCKLGIAEANCESYAERGQWFKDLWAMAAGSAYPCEFVSPFFSGCNGTDVITYHTRNSPASGTDTAIQAMARSGGLLT
jgi:hypothetical protein